MIAAELDVRYRLVGGNTVTLLVAVHGDIDLVSTRETGNLRAPAARIREARTVRDLLRD